MQRTQRVGPNRAFRTRDRHRTWLTLHFVAMLTGLAAALWANRAYYDEASGFWAKWVALGWGLLFAVHLAVFARSTLATMGGRRPD